MTRERDALLKVIDRIQSDGQPVGSRMPSERALSEELKISRNTLRSALRTLEARGMVEIRRGSGCYIVSKEPDPEAPGSFSVVTAGKDTEAYLEARIVLESAIARLAAERREEDDLAKLEQRLVEMSHALLRREIPKIMKQGEEFRLTMARASKNAHLLRSLKTLQETSSQTLFLYRKISETERNDCFASYVDLFNALKAQDGDRAALFAVKCAERLMDKWKSLQEMKPPPPE